ncbi:uncharacterized protein JCM6883_004037 [Sporobolomyces salmoneus]|uniref:uncharacterized protein n=1 Tax=Sporobolomyces salmoneus TaxID=183962 RepID=UPI00317FB828
MSAQDKISRESSITPASPATKEADEALTASLSRMGGPPPFKWSSLWKPAVVNHLNGKSYTIPLLNLRDQYSINFHLAWLGFFVAFLSWFAFPPLIPEAIRRDLNLTPAQIGNSNIAALSSTLIVRFAIGPLVDRYGPRLTMAGLLIVGSIPSGLAGTVTSAEGLYVIRFFIGILGGTFVPCLAWSTCFFDKTSVGTANALVGGWGNLGGGVTFVVMVALYESLIHRGLTDSVAWRASFAIVPVPILWLVAGLCIFVGTDHPAGKWSARHTLPASAIAARQGHFAALDPSERRVIESKMREKSNNATSRVQAVNDDEDEAAAEVPLDLAVSEPLTMKMFWAIMSSSTTWLPGLMYATTFGFELAVDANLANVLDGDHPGLGQLKAGYYTSTFGFLNIVTRPFGGYLGDKVYTMKRFGGVRAKKYLTIVLGFLQGVMTLAYGLYVRQCYLDGSRPDLNTQMGLVVLMAVFCEVGNGANFALVPHCNVNSNGVVSGIVGAMGNFGGILFAIMFRFHHELGYSTAWIIAGGFAMGVNLLCILLRAPKV